MIYLDNAATTFPKPEEVYKAMDRVNRQLSINAGRGSYRLAREANQLIVDTKKMMRELVGVNDTIPVIFSPSITIALNQIINGLQVHDNSVVYYSPFEHNAVARVLHHLEKKKGIKIKELPYDEATGEVLLEQLPYMFAKETPAAVFCTHISNVTGYIVPVSEIFSMSKKHGAINVLDSAQSMGLIEVNAKKLKNVDIIAFAGHKCLYGPFGIGGFINVSGVQLNEYIVGGTGSDSLNLDMPSGEESKYEMASSNIVAIAGLNAALHQLHAEDNYKHEKMLTEYLINGLLNIEGIEIYTPKNEEQRVGIVSFALEGYKSPDVGLILDEDYDISVRTGYHCAPFIHKHLKDEKYLGTVRIGLGKYNTKEEIDSLIKAIKELRWENA
ncbi:MAG: aminotransferase class V-fold PLP-dependent enzyme [Anaerostipes sp.]|nr:aminotransferase class V-fold PLP-dependent enzyme [Anaerostipes sp.]MDD3746277.1 aminotransferase class V-fold PLP-dependent enzyme [Anaerostipes sp.]